MRRLMTMKHRTAAALGIVAALTLGVGAFAYFTGSGSGTGTAAAKVGSSAPTVTITGTTSGELYPGGAQASVSIKVKNEGAQAARVENVSLASITTDEAHKECDTSTGEKHAFTMASISINKTLKPNEEVGATGSLQMNDTGVSQNACQGAPLTLHFTSN